MSSWTQDTLLVMDTERANTSLRGLVLFLILCFDLYLMMSSYQLLAQSGLQGTSFRIGQITGGHPNGAWATSDWVPILVKSSLAMNVLPSATGVRPIPCLSFEGLSLTRNYKVSAWLPMDAVSQAVLDVAWSAQSPPALNVVHPRPVSWNTIMDNVNDAIVEEGIKESRLPTVTFGAWVKELESQATGASSETINNIVRVLLLFPHFLIY